MRSIFNEVSLYFGIELAATAAKEKALIDLRVQALLKFLFQRGDAHRYYQYPFIRSLYLGHDKFFRRGGVFHERIEPPPGPVVIMGHEEL